MPLPQVLLPKGQLCQLATLSIKIMLAEPAMMKSPFMTAPALVCRIWRWRQWPCAAQSRQDRQQTFHSDRQPQKTAGKRLASCLCQNQNQPLHLLDAAGLNRKCPNDTG